MRNFYIFFSLLLISSAFVGCSKIDSYSFENANGRIIGTWTISKVEVKIPHDGKWGKTDVSSNFKDSKLDFQEDGSLIMYDAKADQSYYGIWYLYEDYSWDEDDQEQETTYKVHIYLEHPDSSSIYREMIWEEMSISDSEFKALHKRDVPDQGIIKYYYTLTR